MRGLWTRVGALGQIVLAFAAMFVFAALIGGLVARLLPEALRMPIQALGLWGGVIAGAFMLRFSKTSYAAIGFTPPKSWLKTIGWALGALVVANIGVIGLGVLIQATTAWPPLDVGYIRNSIEGNLGAYVVWMLLVVWGSAGFGEELLARGFIMDRLQIVFGRGNVGIVLAVVIQAAIFGALHAIQGPTGVVITAWVGIVFAGLYFATGRNLWAPIIAHGVTDSIGLTLMYLGIPLWGYIQ